ncbi:hypothetical protein B224_3425 [Aeromonas media WS]|nr:hypothetical protein B224_3425 [Aeromonas media WS]
MEVVAGPVSEEHELIAEVDGTQHRQGRVVLPLIAGIATDDGTAQHQPLGHRAGEAVLHEDIEGAEIDLGPGRGGEQQGQERAKGGAVQGANRGHGLILQSRGWQSILPMTLSVKPVFI